MGFTVAEGKIVEIDAIADPERVRTDRRGRAWRPTVDPWPHPPRPRGRRPRPWCAPARRHVRTWPQHTASSAPAPAGHRGRTAPSMRAWSGSGRSRASPPGLRRAGARATTARRSTGPPPGSRPGSGRARQAAGRRPRGRRVAAPRAGAGSGARPGSRGSTPSPRPVRAGPASPSGGGGPRRRLARVKRHRGSDSAGAPTPAPPRPGRVSTLSLSRPWRARPATLARQGPPAPCPVHARRPRRRPSGRDGGGRPVGSTARRSGRPAASPARGRCSGLGVMPAWGAGGGPAPGNGVGRISVTPLVSATTSSDPSAGPRRGPARGTGEPTPPPVNGWLTAPPGARTAQLQALGQAPDGGGPPRTPLPPGTCGGRPTGTGHSLARVGRCRDSLPGPGRCVPGCPVPARASREELAREGLDLDPGSGF